MEEAKPLKRLMMAIPFVWDLYLYFWFFPRVPRGHRGVYQTYAEAAATCPKGRAVGYNQKVISEHPDPAKLTAGGKIGAFNSRDYPLLVWLAKAFRDGKTVFDFGGNLGLGYYSYGRYIDYPEGLKWVVCEIGEICKVGRKIAEEKGAKNLVFTEDFSEADGVDIFMTCGVLQFLEDSLVTRLKKLKRLPRHLFVHRTPMGDGPTFYTLENIGFTFVPYRIENQQELWRDLEGLGYELVDSWFDGKDFRIPFHPKNTAKGYCGGYFRLKKV
jgi:putative methyltransferase (TIGR04325 family)